MAIHIRRREFIFTLGGAADCVPLAAVTPQRIGFDLLPNLPSFIRRVCSGYALVWGVLRTQSV